jgi:DNA gyrase/topoisomerase IV subunit A
VVIRTQVDEVRATGRDTMGVSFMDLPDDIFVAAVAKLESEPDALEIGDEEIQG